MMFYLLTDPIRNGDIIRAEGRKHYAYSFGVCRWVRTTVMLSYMNPNSPLYGQYCEVSEKEAQERVIKKSSLLVKLLSKAEALAYQYHAGQVDKGGNPYIDHVKAVAEQLDDLEQKITAWLHDLCEDTEVTPEFLQKEGFTPRIVQAVQVLTKSPGMEYFAYIRQVRKNAIARAVKIADLENNMDLRRIPHPGEKDKQRIQKYQIALSYLKMEGELPDTAHQEGGQEEQYLPTMKVFQNVRKQALGGRKIPHGVSNPVLRRTEDGKVYLAFFVYLYNKSNLDVKKMPRPSSWILADISCGKIFSHISCAQKDFSSQSKDILYSVNYPQKPIVDANWYTELFQKLDQVRIEYCNNGRINEEVYKSYMDLMLTVVPPDYRIFYNDLSAL